MCVSRKSTVGGRLGYESGRASAARIPSGSLIRDGAGSAVDGQDNPPSGDGEGANPDPMSLVARHPYVQTEPVQSTALVRVRHVFGNADDDHAPAGTAAGIDPIDFKRRLFSLHQPVELGPRCRAEHDAL